MEIDKIACEKSWVHLSDKEKQSLNPLRERLNQLASVFMNNLNESRKEINFSIPERFLWDMPMNFREAALKEGEAKWTQDYVFTFTPANEGALLKYVTDETIRKEVYRASINLAHKKNSDIVVEMISLRKKYSEQLGYESYADYAIQGKMAKNKAQIIDLYKERIPTYKASFEEDIQKLCGYFWLSEMKIWDFSYYKTKYISETLGVNPAQVQSYLKYENVLEGIFRVIEKIFGVKFEETTIETYDEKVKVFLVSKDGKKLWYYMPDLFTHPWKRQWAWAEVLKKSTKWEKIMTNVWNIANTEGKQYFSIYDIRVIFHELWHMVHELISPQTDKRLSGFEVESDALEIPSMFFENFSTTYELAHHYLKHEETWDVIPREIFDAFEQEANFCSDYWKLRRLYYSLFDLKIHSDSIPTTTQEIQNIFYSLFTSSLPFIWLAEEHNNIASSFHHLFYSAAGMYVAGFYSYSWSEEMQSEIWNKVMETGGPLHSPVIKKYINEMLSQGARKPSSELYDSVMQS